MEETLTNFELTGDDLGLDLDRFLDEMKSRDPQMGDILARHAQILKTASTDEARKQARLTFNSAVRVDLKQIAAEDV
jgi:hypothetical protein